MINDNKTVIFINGISSYLVVITQYCNAQYIPTTELCHNNYIRLPGTGTRLCTLCENVSCLGLSSAHFIYQA